MDNEHSDTVNGTVSRPSFWIILPPRGPSTQVSNNLGARQLSRDKPVLDCALTPL